MRRSYRPPSATCLTLPSDSLSRFAVNAQAELKPFPPASPRFAGVPPTPFDSGRAPAFGQPLVEKNVLDGRARPVVQPGREDRQDAQQGVAALDRDRPDQ